MDGEFPPNFYIIRDQLGYWLVVGPDTNDSEDLPYAYTACETFQEAEDALIYMEELYGEFPH